MKIKFPNGTEIECTPEEWEKLRPLAPVPVLPVINEPVRAEPPWHCTCPTMWMGIFPPPRCSYCASRNPKMAPWSGTLTVGGYDPALLSWNGCGEMFCEGRME